MAIITIIGAGMMGSALAFPARENGHEVRLVGTHLDRDIIAHCRQTGSHPKFDRPFPAGVKFYDVEEADSAISGCHFVICGVSSFGVEWFSENMLPRIPETTPVLAVTKGLLDLPDGTVKTFPDYWREEAGKHGRKPDINAIGGPCTSYELVAHDHSHVTFCGRNPETLRFLKSCLSTDYYHISLSTDVTGVECAVALKNGYALGVALSIGANRKVFGDDTLHYNSQAALFGQSVEEMRRLLRLFCGNDAALSVGAGDLYVTVYGGRTRLVGILLGEGLTIDEALERLQGVTLESLVISKRVYAALRRRFAEEEIAARFPLLAHVSKLIAGEQAPIPWDAFTSEKFN